jgi:hypothetical protein
MAHHCLGNVVVRSVCCISFVALASATLGCGSSTAPTPALSAAQLVAHFDSLAVECTPSHDPAWCDFVNVVNIGPLEGVVPSRVQITTSAGAGDWYGFVLRGFNSPQATSQVDTSYVFVAYDGLSLQHVVWMGLENATSRPFAFLLADSTLWQSGEYEAVTGSVSITMRSTGGPCTTEVGPPVPCQMAQFQVSMNITMQPNPGSPLPPRTIVVAPQTVVGTTPVGASAGQPVSSSSTARRANKSAISMAARAASAPLLPCSPPARASACSIVSHVSNPNPTGV